MRRHLLESSMALRRLASCSSLTHPEQRYIHAIILSIPWTLHVSLIADSTLMSAETSIQSQRTHEQSMGCGTTSSTVYTCTSPMPKRGRLRSQHYQNLQQKVPTDQAKFESPLTCSIYRDTPLFEASKSISKSICQVTQAQSITHTPHPSQPSTTRPTAELTVPSPHPARYASTTLQCESSSISSGPTYSHASAHRPATCTPAATK